MKRLALFVINFYRNYLSILKLPTCRFYPSCSKYMEDAILKYGLVKGVAKGALRLMRCHPYSKGGYDPA
ncbi:MAG: membrane protein insertion efficiency factor YidD [Candidatus Omnitrophica bacterium]|nr:membrane protein insertion efficiency factor YidD [Candidatus Omnitrophota bacterium]